MRLSFRPYAAKQHQRNHANLTLLALHAPAPSGRPPHTRSQSLVICCAHPPQSLAQPCHRSEACSAWLLCHVAPTSTLPSQERSVTVSKPSPDVHSDSPPRLARAPRPCWIRPCDLANQQQSVSTVIYPQTYMSICDWPPSILSRRADHVHRGRACGIFPTPITLHRSFTGIPHVRSNQPSCCAAVSVNALFLQSWPPSRCRQRQSLRPLLAQI